MSLPEQSYSAPPCTSINWIAGGDHGERCGCTTVSRIGYCPRCGAYRPDFDQDASRNSPQNRQGCWS